MTQTAQNQSGFSNEARFNMAGDAAGFNAREARFNMIEQQIRTWEVLDPVVLELFNQVPRESFVAYAERIQARPAYVAAKAIDNQLIQEAKQ